MSSQIARQFTAFDPIHRSCKSRLTVGQLAMTSCTRVTTRGMMVNGLLTQVASARHGRHGLCAMPVDAMDVLSSFATKLATATRCKADPVNRSAQ
jgi:hypothetical protein